MGQVVFFIRVWAPPQEFPKVLYLGGKAPRGSWSGGGLLGLFPCMFSLSSSDKGTAKGSTGHLGPLSVTLKCVGFVTWKHGVEPVGDTFKENSCGPGSERGRQVWRITQLGPSREEGAGGDPRPGGGFRPDKQGPFQLRGFCHSCANPAPPPHPPTRHLGKEPAWAC